MAQTHQTHFESGRIKAPNEFILEMASIALSITKFHYRMKNGDGCPGEGMAGAGEDPGDFLAQHVRLPYPHPPLRRSTSSSPSYDGFQRYQPCFLSRIMVLDQLHSIFASMNPIWKLDQLWII